MKNKKTKMVATIRKEMRNNSNIDSYERIIKVHENLVKRGLTKNRGYSLATIMDKPFEYLDNSKNIKI